MRDFGAGAVRIVGLRGRRVVGIGNVGVDAKRGGKRIVGADAKAGGGFFNECGRLIVAVDRGGDALIILDAVHGSDAEAAEKFEATLEKRERIGAEDTLVDRVTVQVLATAETQAEWIARGDERGIREVGEALGPVGAIVGNVRRERLPERVALRAIADALNARGIATARGGRWAAQTVANVLKRAA